MDLFGCLGSPWMSLDVLYGLSLEAAGSGWLHLVAHHCMSLAVTACRLMSLTFAAFRCRRFMVLDLAGYRMADVVGALLPFQAHAQHH